MKKTSYLLSFTLIACLLLETVHAEFAFGLYPELNSTKNQLQIEQKYNFTSPIVGYIFDTFTEKDAAHLRTAVKTL